MNGRYVRTIRKSICLRMVGFSMPKRKIMRDRIAGKVTGSNPGCDGCVCDEGENAV